MGLSKPDDASDCCAPTISLVQSTGEGHTCPHCHTPYLASPANEIDDASAVYTRFDVPHPSAEPRAHARREARARRHLGDELRVVLVELELARRWASGGGRGAGGAPDRSPLARLQGDADGADGADRRTVDHVLDQVLEPTTKAAKLAAAKFERLMVDYCARAADELDDDEGLAGKPFHERLQSIDPAVRVVLRALQRRVTPRASWAEACRAVGDECAPPALRLAWEGSAGPGTPGRPRRDPSQPPPDAERIAYGHELVTRAMAAWSRAAET